MSFLNRLMGPTSRRDMLKLASVGALGASASGWTDVLAREVPQQPRNLALPGKAKNCIVLFMSGGPAHTWTFDLKRGERGCPYEPINTTVPGIQISEYLPSVAKQMHHLALVRGMSTDIADHENAHYLMRTGFRQMAGVVHPHFGSTAVSQLVKEDTGLPSFVLLKPGSGSQRGVSSGYLNPATRPLILRDVGQGIANLQPAQGLEVMRNRMGLLEGADREFISDYQADAARAHLAGYQKAAQLMDMEKAREAFKLEREPQHIRDLYGDTPFGRQCLGARRLIENGVRFVEVMHPDYWDTHGSQLNGQRKLSSVLDRPMGALLADLDARGLLDETLVVWMGEFGRAPLIEREGGRGHWGRCYSVVLAGAGIRPGLVHGRSDRHAANPVEGAVSPQDLVTTIYNCLGIGMDTELIDALGRPLKLCQGRPIGGVLA